MASVTDCLRCLSIAVALMVAAMCVTIFRKAAAFDPENAKNNPFIDVDTVKNLALGAAMFSAIVAVMSFFLIRAKARAYGYTYIFCVSAVVVLQILVWVPYSRPYDIISRSSLDLGEDKVDTLWNYFQDPENRDAYKLAREAWKPCLVKLHSVKGEAVLDQYKDYIKHQGDTGQSNMTKTAFCYHAAFFVAVYRRACFEPIYGSIVGILEAGLVFLAWHSMMSFMGTGTPLDPEADDDALEMHGMNPPCLFERVECPPGAKPGDSTTITTPMGHTVDATIPAGVFPPMVFSVQVPA